MSAPWNDWYHCTGNTYGTWLRGSPLGYRERKHRLHVEGDYRAPPPPGLHDQVLARSKDLMSHPPVHLTPTQRELALRAMVSKLLSLRIKLIALSLDDHHFHALARFPDRKPRVWMGKAKMHASMILSDAGLSGRVWARKSRAQPVQDRSHQVRVFHYIVRHSAAGASVWTFRDPALEQS